jgi:uncharacterized protein YjiS (DUF1127 family)
MANRRELGRRSFAPATLAAAGPAATLQRTSTLSPVGFSSAVQHALMRAVATVSAWHERARQRRALVALSDPMLRDIGISRAQAQRESTRPFWRV